MSTAWPQIYLDQICRPKQWPTIPANKLLNDGFPVYGANGKIGFYSEYNHEFPTILITCRGATCGTINVSEPRSYITGNAMCLDDLDEDRCHLEFIVYALRYRGFNDAITGSAQPQITRQSLEKVAIPLPPLSEQKRIAAILDKADAIRKKRKQAIELTETFLRSAFLEMFGDPVTNPKGWEESTLQDLCHRITDGTHQPPKWADSGIPFLFVSNIVNGQISFDTKKFISEKTWASLTERCPIELNDILYTTVGSYGNAALVDTLDKFCFQRHIAHIKPNANRVHPLFLLGMMQSPGVKRQADEQVRGVAQKTLNLRELKVFKVMIPPKEKQLEYAKIRQRAKESAQRQDELAFKESNLINSLIQRAFRGEL